MSYQLNSTIHNTQWVTAHFHLIFAGAIVIMYFAIAYDLWPHLTGRAMRDFRLIRTQLWLWFIGMNVLTLPWHYAGLLGMPRRMAYYDYTAAGGSTQALTVIMSVIGGAILVVSAGLFLAVLVRNHRAERVEPGIYTFSRPVHEPASLPWSLNGLGLWVGLMIALTITNYGFPIYQLLRLHDARVPAVYVGGNP
jgi:cytochrome c oxidase subunit 1